MIARPLTGVRYRDAILRVVVIPLISGLTLALLIRDHAPVLALTIAAITIAQTNYASHWIGWLRHPTVITYTIRNPRMKTNRRSTSAARLAVVSSTLMIGLMISAGCPPGDTEPPKTPAEESVDKDEDENKSEEKSEKSKDDVKNEEKSK